MKKLILVIISILGSVLLSIGQTVELMGTSVTSHRSQYMRPVKHDYFSFKGKIALGENPKAFILCGNDTIAEATQYIVCEACNGEMTITFDTIYLDKGKSFVYHVAAGTVTRRDSSHIVNEAMDFPIYVPANLGPYRADFEGKVLNHEVSSLGVDWPHEVALADTSAKALLYREDVPIYEFNIRASWDWDIGSAGPDMKRRGDGFPPITNYRFEKGVRYRLEMPAGSICARLRGDIVNDEDIVVDFFGGWERTPFIPLDPEEVNIAANDDGQLDSLAFSYNRRVQLTPADHGIELWEENGGTANMVKSVTPEIYYDRRGSRIKADFGSYKVNPDMTYYIKIPEATFVTQYENVVVNEPGYIPVGMSAKGMVLGTDVKVERRGENIVIHGKDTPVNIAVYTIWGGRLFKQANATLPISIPMPKDQVHIVKVGERYYKVI